MITPKNPMYTYYGLTTDDPKPTNSTQTLSGSVVSFSLGNKVELRDVSTNIVAVQLGSGTPSPSNVRPIKGFNIVNLKINNEDLPIDLGQTVYGGMLNVTTGLLNITHKKISISSVSWTRSSGTYPFFSVYLSDIERIASWAGTMNAKSNIYVAATGNAASTSEDYCVFGTPNEDAIRVRDNRFTDAATFKANSGGEIVYKMKTPQTIQLTPTQIKNLLSQNNISSNSGDISVTLVENNIVNGTVFFEMDSGKKYVYDAENSLWVEQ